MNAIRVELLQPAWIPAVSQIHMCSLPNDFLPGLGMIFLQDVFYPAVLKSPHARTFVALEEDQPVGFVVTTRNSAAFFRTVIKGQLWGFLKTGLHSSLTSFSSLRNNLQVLLSVFKKEPNQDFGEIYEIAIQADRQGRGIGRQLVAESIVYLQSAGAAGIKIKTLRSNQAWIAFFQKNGWELTQETTLIGRQYVILALKFSDESPDLILPGA